MVTLIGGEASVLEHLREKFKERLLVKSANLTGAWVRETETVSQGNNFS